MSEREMYPMIGSYLCREGYSKVSYELPQRRGSARTIDVVGFKSLGRSTVVVEAKLSHYAQALRQGQLRLLISDFVYISFPAEYAQRIERERRDKLEELGLGLLAVDGQARELVPPEESPWVNAERKEALIQMIIDEK